MSRLGQWAHMGSMQELTDTQNERDDRNLPIDRVGIKSLKHPVEVLERDGGLQHTIADVSLAVDLPHEKRGTHMSRFVEALNEHGNYLDVRDPGEVPRQLQKRLEAERAWVTYQFPFFRSKEAPVTGKRSRLSYEVRLEVEAGKAERESLVLTVIVPVTTLCPCSKAISERGAHNQRGIVTFSIRSSKVIWIEDAIEIVEESASSELYSLLKRSDEKAVTERAYDHPVFVEDLVRNVAQRSEKQGSILWYRVEAENFESIHNHSAYAEIENEVG